MTFVVLSKLPHQQGYWMHDVVDISTQLKAPMCLSIASSEP